MACFKINFVLFINFLSIFKVSLLETVHFTNSPNKILKANNFTTYKVEVPNGEPITIIEANMPLINKNIKFNEVENTKYSINQNQDNRNHVVDLKTSLSMTVTPHNNNDEYEKLSAGGEESVTNDYGNLSPEHSHQQHHTMKTVYSPELLEKFLKDYANKVHSTEATIEPLKPVNQEEFMNKYSSIDTEAENYATDKYANDKYASIEAEPEGENNDDDGNRRVSSANEETEPAGASDIQERKHYRPGSGGNNNNYPYNKNSGWVTLEAIPWSKSKVSKWQSSVKPFTNSQSNYNYQSSNNNNNYNRPPSRPPTYNYEEEHNDNDDYYSQKPSRPSYQNNQYYGGGSSSSNNRPPQDLHPSYSHHSSSHHSSSYNGNNNNYDNDYRPNRPEIITDNRPSNFPNHDSNNHHHYESYEQNQNRPGQYDRPSHHDRPGHYDRPNSNDRPSSYDRPQRPPFNDYHSSGSHNYNHYSNKDGNHPLTYPSASDGEWVLVSTTKGYQFPKRNGERAMVFKAQNGVTGGDTRKNDNKGIITAASHNYETTVSIRPPYQAGPTKTTQQQVKLTVLPLFVKNENGPHQNNHYNNNNMDMNIYRPSNYNGVIEADPSTQTIEESVAAAANANEANSVNASPQKLPKKKRKHMKNYAIMRKNPGSDSTAMLAAVGAGLLPASLGLIAPMVLGK